MAAYEELVKRAIASGKHYEDLPPRIQNVLSPYEWKTRVKEWCVQRGVSWSGSLAGSVCSEQEYYDDLIKSYKSWLRVFPYHLSDYVCRVQRTTPFKYYCDLLFNVLRDEKSYDRIPNFTAADIMRIMGIGRNEYISTLNACKAKKLMWRVNKGLARDFLPTEPLPTTMQPWWLVSVVNLGELEYRELSEDELAHLKTANLPDHIRVKDLDAQVVGSLLMRGLVYLQVPVSPEDRFSIPPLEGFVSNKTAEQGDAASDPIESLLYAVFVANSERLKVADLAGILNVSLTELQAALGIAVRLGFATRLTDDSAAGVNRGSVLQFADYPDPVGAAQQEGSPMLGDLLGMGDSAGEGEGHAVAVVVDAEATSYLMMGALSPGLKRHSVTLFEGGRVVGEEVMRELVDELWVSYQAGQGFEGDMLQLTHYCAALATTLEVVKESSGNRPIELLRKESLAGLSPAAACKVLYHAYCAVVPICPLPAPPLPLTPDRPGPAYFGPTVEASGPWLQLALYTAARCGPCSVVFTCGQRVQRLPPMLQGCSHALLWPWDVDPNPATRAKAGATGSADGTAALAESNFVLYSLNEMLSRTAVMVQPIDGHAAMVAAGAAPLLLEAHSGEVDDPGAAAAAAAVVSGVGVAVVDVPLPLDVPSSDPLAHLSVSSTQQQQAAGEPEPSSLLAAGIERSTSASCSVPMPASVRRALDEVGLASSLGFLRMIRLPTLGPVSAGAAGPPHASSGATGTKRSSYSGAGGLPPLPHAPASSTHKPASPSTSSSSQGTTSAAGPQQQLVRNPSSTRRQSSTGGNGTGTSGSAGAACATVTTSGWMPLSISLGMPLYCLPLCKAVCQQARSAGFLSAEGRAAQARSQARMHARLTDLVSELTLKPAVSPVLRGSASAMSFASSAAGAAGQLAQYRPVELPAYNLYFDGSSLQRVDLSAYLQGAPCELLVG